PLDARRLEDPALPDRIGGHRLAELLDDLDRLVDVRSEGDRDVLVDPGPRPRPVRRDLDLAVRDGMDDPVEIAERRPAEAEVLDRSADPRDRDDIALAVLVLDEDQGPVQVVPDEALGAEPDGDPDDAEPGHGGTDVEIERAEDHDPGDQQDEAADDVGAELVERVHPLLDLDRRELLGGALGRLAVEQGLDDAVDQEGRDAYGDDRHDDDDEDPEAARPEDIDDRAQRRVGEVHDVRW